MNDHTPFACRMIAALIRMVAYSVRGFLAAVGTDPAATTALGVFLLVVLLAAPLVWKSAVVTGRCIERHLASHRERRAFAEIARHYDDTAADPLVAGDEPTQVLPGVVQLGPATPPHHELPHRRPFGMRVLGRRIARRQTPTSPDRRH